MPTLFISLNCPLSCPLALALALAYPILIPAAPVAPPSVIIRRIIDADNSCLFNAVGYALRRKRKVGSELRLMITEAVRGSPDVYNEARWTNTELHQHIAVSGYLLRLRDAISLQGRAKLPEHPRDVCHVWLCMWFYIEAIPSRQHA